MRRLNTNYPKFIAEIERKAGPRFQPPDAKLLDMKHGPKPTPHRERP